MFYSLSFVKYFFFTILYLYEITHGAQTLNLSILTPIAIKKGWHKANEEDIEHQE